MIPSLGNNRGFRAFACQIAERWRTDQGRLCFTTDVPNLDEMLGRQPNLRIAFPSLSYVNARGPSTSTANLALAEAPRFRIAKYVTGSAPADQIKEVLRAHGVSMTGRKEQLLEKLARLSSKVYAERRGELDRYFSRNRFVRIENGSGRHDESFPVLEDFHLRNMIIAMYVLKHLRGNTMLEAGYENETYDLVSLARALVKREVAPSGAFLRVE